ncbi:phospholipase A1-Igamma2, chloroplastic-like [Syzygium oleosum]|uniref:phospholipase A1-Igamma2, chloroplastic-like n=1 Tax=Syzygium oleosum TaxID=219896 RepID=UPI0011D1E100|nr:phospholipase A1-Igamma2, chloroplastic-like [Syzygium oleosum]
MAIPYRALFFRDHTHHNKIFTFNDPISPSIRSIRFSCGGLTRRETPSNGRLFIQNVSSKNESLCIVPGLQSERTKENGHWSTIEEPSNNLASTWEEIHGKSDWVGLLDPIDPLLWAELIRYGEMAQASYDAFDADLFSKYCGSCRYKPSEFFRSLEFPRAGYEVTRYLYASCNIHNHPHFFKKSLWRDRWSESANWFGYVAVSDDEMSKALGRRDIAIVWRGTMRKPEWIVDAMYSMSPVRQKGIPCPDRKAKVESGFLHLYTEKDENSRFCKHSAREHVLQEIEQLVRKHADEDLSITITGHSLGSALAILSAYDIAETGTDIRQDGKIVPKCVFSFAGPRVGNARFKQRIEELGVKVLRVLNVHDKVPTVPGMIFNEYAPSILQKWGCYSHVGIELALNHENSPYLKDEGDLLCYHDMEVLLHLLDGYKGKGQKFELASKRDIALVNKATDFLKDELLVPPKWMQLENKGLVRGQDGRWTQPERQDLGDHFEGVNLEASLV